MNAGSDACVHLCIGLTAHRDLAPEQEPGLCVLVRNFFWRRYAARIPAAPQRLFDLDYRGLAEGLRVQLYWRMAGVEIPPNSSLG